MNTLYSTSALKNSSLAPALLRGSQAETLMLPGDWGVRCPDLRLQMHAIQGKSESELQLLRPLGGWIGRHDSPYHKHMVRTVDTLLTHFPLPNIIPLISHGSCAAAGDFKNMVVHRAADKDAFTDIIPVELEDAVREGARNAGDPDVFRDEFTRLVQLQSVANLMSYPVMGTTFAEVIVREKISVAPIFCTFGKTPSEHVLTVLDTETHDYIRNHQLQERIEQEEPRQSEFADSARSTKMIEALDQEIASFTNRIRSGGSSRVR